MNSDLHAPLLVKADKRNARLVWVYASIDAAYVMGAIRVARWDPDRKAYALPRQALPTLIAAAVGAGHEIVDDSDDDDRPPHLNELCDHMRDPRHCPYCPGRRLAHLEPTDE